MPSIRQKAEYLLTQLSRCTTEADKIEVIESVLEEYGNSWVSVDERLPPNDQVVITWHINRYYYGTRMHMNVRREELYGWMLSGCSKPTHWMPLPDAPNHNQER